MIIGRQLVNEYYEDERLYSTGDDELDEMLEKAFCEGYEYAQKEFTYMFKGAIYKNNGQLMKTAKQVASMPTMLGGHSGPFEPLEPGMARKIHNGVMLKPIRKIKPVSGVSSVVTTKKPLHF